MTPTALADWLTAGHVLVRATEDRARLDDIATLLRQLDGEAEYLSVPRAAQRVNISRRTLQLWITKGLVPVRYTVGGHPRVRIADLLAGEKRTGPNPRTRLRQNVVG